VIRSLVFRELTVQSGPALPYLIDNFISPFALTYEVPLTLFTSRVSGLPVGLFANSDLKLNLSHPFNFSVPNTVVCIELCEPVTERPRSPVFLVCEFIRTST
jgi:hypothetical protein